MNARKPRGRPFRKFTAQQRASWVKRFTERQNTTVEFARQHGLGVSTLFQWVRQAQRKPVRQAQPTPTPTPFRRLEFQEVTLKPVSGGSWSAEVQLPDGTQLRWNSQADLVVMERVLQQLRQSC